MFIILVFLFCAVFYAISFDKTQERKDNLAKLCMVFLCLVSGLRMLGGTDFYAYEGFYEVTPVLQELLKYSYQDYTYEIGYTVLISCLKTFGISYYGYIFINSVFFYLCLWIGLKRYIKEYQILILVFLYKLFFYNTFISMRQSITVAGFFLLIPLIVEKKWIKYYVFSFLLTRFHNGAYILFLLYPIAYFDLTKKRLILLNVIFIPTMALSFAGIDVLAPMGSVLGSIFSMSIGVEKVSSYFDNQSLSEIGIFHTLEYFLLMFFVVKNYDKIVKLPDYQSICLKLFICLLPLFTLLRANEILTREKDYFTIFYAVILYYMTQINTGYQRSLWRFAVFAVCAFGYVRFVILFDLGAMLEYKTWLLESSYNFFNNKL